MCSRDLREVLNKQRKPSHSLGQHLDCTVVVKVQSKALEGSKSQDPGKGVVDGN